MSRIEPGMRVDQLARERASRRIGARGLAQRRAQLTADLGGQLAEVGDELVELALRASHQMLAWHSTPTTTSA